MRFFIIGLLTLVLMIFLWLAVISVVSIPTGPLWTQGIIVKKELAAKAWGARPKILLVGGSSVHYGFSAEAIAKATGWPTVNMGTHAGLGAKYLVTRAMRSANRGDIVVLSIEYLLLTTLDQPSDFFAEFWSYHNHDASSRDYIADTSLVEQGHLLFGVPPTKVIWRSEQAKIPATVTTPEVIYGPQTINNYGDAMLNDVALVTPEARKRVRETAPLSSVRMVPKQRQFLADVQSEAAARGIQLYFAWPPALKHAAYENEDYHAMFESIRAAYNDNHIQVLGNVTDTLVPFDETLDTAYHLNQQGRAKFTARFIKNLCTSIQCKLTTSQSITPPPLDAVR